MGILRSADGASRLSGSSGNTANLSIISPGAHLVGDVRAEGTVRVEGAVEGSVHVHGQVLVAPGGVVDGDILAAHVIVGGEVRGEIQADDMAELHPGGSVAGNIVTPRIAVADGATFNGRLRTAKPEAARRETLAPDAAPRPSPVGLPPAASSEFRSAS